ncbi:iron complex transport system substrate-binding protein [Candidatus Electrothrix aarhusensis]|uniref:Iron complex transport system substrate-binding protein n=1 Tax=Candidatus Electrothrix aarhusensis TaxID=1859131 RepID=A0A3S3QLQ2_9BACT|nr:iron complex transport system substrate-binding protein [Candidatus Electrothrix aarhusensis]
MRKPMYTTAFFLIITLLSCAFPLHGQAGPNPFPQRIVSLGPINTENVYLLGAEDRLVGNTSYCVRPEAAKDKKKIGSVMQVSIEKILSLRPDLVLATGLTQPQQLNKLRALGLRVVQFQQPSSFAEICAQFRRVGELLGLEERAEQVVQEAERKVEAVAVATAQLPRPKVFLQIGSRPLFGAAKDSFTHDFIALSGAVNVIEEQQHGTASYEKILMKDPEVIIIAMMGSESGIAQEEKKKWQGFPLAAVQNNQVHVVSPDLACSPSPATFAETLSIMAALIHPELASAK